MKHAWFIVQLHQIGNIGAHEIKKITEQPKDGFEVERYAEIYLQTLFDTGEYPYDRLFSFAIIKLYTALK